MVGLVFYQMSLAVLIISPVRMEDVYTIARFAMAMMIAMIDQMS